MFRMPQKELPPDPSSQNPNALAYDAALLNAFITPNAPLAALFVKKKERGAERVKSEISRKAGQFFFPNH